MELNKAMRVYAFLTGLLLLTSICPAKQHKINVIGKAEYCTVSQNEIQCVDHTFNQCLRTLSMTSDGIKCIKNSTK